MEDSNLKKSTGVTLVELLIVLAIAAILVQIALPDFSDIMKNNRSAARINELQTSLAFARTEAVKRNTPVALCRSTDGATCNDGDSDWQGGWIVYADEDGSGSANDNETLSFYGTADEKFTLTFSATRVSYGGTGLATLGIGETYVLCDDRGDESAKGVIIGPGGRPRLAVDGDENGVVEDADGDDLACS